MQSTMIVFKLSDLVSLDVLLVGHKQFLDDCRRHTTSVTDDIEVHNARRVIELGHPPIQGYGSSFSAIAGIMIIMMIKVVGVGIIIIIMVVGAEMIIRMMVVGAEIIIMKCKSDCKLLNLGIVQSRATDRPFQRSQGS